MLVSLAKELHRKISEAEEQKYDMEMRIRKHDYEVFLSKVNDSISNEIKFYCMFKINELTVKVNDIKGKFIKPTLKKVSKTKSK
jgi:troponin I